MMDFREQAKRKHETYSKNTETTDLLNGHHGSLVFYTKDAGGAVRMHTYTEEGRTIELVDRFPTVIKPRVVKEEVAEVVVEKKVAAPKKNEGIVAKAVRKLKGE
jgi:hypothetical protein